MIKYALTAHQKPMWFGYWKIILIHRCVDNDHDLFQIKKVWGSRNANDTINEFFKKYEGCGLNADANYL